MKFLKIIRGDCVAIAVTYFYSFKTSLHQFHDIKLLTKAQSNQEISLTTDGLCTTTNLWLEVHNLCCLQLRQYMAVFHNLNRSLLVRICKTLILFSIKICVATKANGRNITHPHIVTWYVKFDTEIYAIALDVNSRSSISNLETFLNPCSKCLNSLTVYLTLLCNLNGLDILRTLVTGANNVTHNTHYCAISDYC
jgi:hypothetical protein